MITTETKLHVILDVPIAEIIVGSRFRKSFTGIPELAASIEAVGLLQPIGITNTKELVFGHRRLKALESLGRTHVNVKIVETDNLLLAEHDENECRAAFTLSEKVAIAEALRPKIEAASKARQSLAGESFGSGKIACVNVPQAEQPRTRDAVAAKVGLSAPTLAKAQAVVAAAKADPVKFGPIAEKMDASDNASAAYAAVTGTPAAKPAPRSITLKDIMAALALLDNADRYSVIDECCRLNAKA
jgi:hypothetical protein